jgi:hypothetical protein
MREARRLTRQHEHVITPNDGRLVIPREAPGSSGLWLPAWRRSPLPEIPQGSLLAIGRPPGDLDMFGAAIDPIALGLPEVDLQEIADILDTIAFEPAMVALAAINASVWFAEASPTKHLKLAEEVFGAGNPILVLIRRFVAEGAQHVVFNEQHFVMLMRLLITGRSPTVGFRDLTDAEVDALTTAIIGIGSQKASGLDPQTDLANPKSWVPAMARMGLYFDRSNIGSDQGRARALFVELFQDLARNSDNWCDLSAWMREDLGAFDNQLAFAAAMGAFSRCLEEDLPLTGRLVTTKTDGLLSGQMAPEVVSRFVAGISADRGELAEHFEEAGMDRDHILWDRAPFERRPFLRLEDGRLLLLGPRFLRSWMGDGFYYRLLDSARVRRPPKGRSRNSALRFTRLHGELMERYVLRLTEDAHRVQRRAGVVRVIGEQPYTGEDGSESFSPDLVLSYGAELVAVEVTGGRPARKARVLSEPTAMLDALDRVIGKLEELDGAVKSMLDGYAVIEGVDLALVRRVWPVVVIPSELFQNELLWAHIDARAPSLFLDARVQLPTLFSIEDYERIMGVVEQGHGLPSLLAARNGSVYRTMPPASFLARHFPGNHRPRYLDQQMREAGEDVRHALFDHGEKAT